MLVGLANETVEGSEFMNGKDARCALNFDGLFDCKYSWIISMKWLENLWDFGMYVKDCTVCGSLGSSYKHVSMLRTRRWTLIKKGICPNRIGCGFLWSPSIYFWLWIDIFTIAQVICFMHPLVLSLLSNVYMCWLCKFLWSFSRDRFLWWSWWVIFIFKQYVYRFGY